MNLRLIGAVLVVAGCGAVGFSIANSYRREERGLQMLIQAVEDMICELQYRMTALPELCQRASESCTGPVQALFQHLAWLLSQQACPDAQGCMAVALADTPRIPEAVRRNLLLLGNHLGRFDAAGQLSGLRSVRELAARDLAGLRSGLDVRLRACQTLGLCAGAALAILLI